jgi:hypothetical protein
MKNYTTRDCINGHEINVRHVIFSEGDTEFTTFNVTFCPRGMMNNPEDAQMIIDEGNFPACKVDCEHWPNCGKDPKFNLWGHFTDLENAKEYVE